MQVKRRKRKRIPAKCAEKMQLESASFAPILIGALEFGLLIISK
jgi:hypothetical protein